MNERTSIVDKKPEGKSQNMVSQIRRNSESMNSPVDRILFLQRTIGNQAVTRLIQSGALQAKLRIGPAQAEVTSKQEPVTVSSEMNSEQKVMQDIKDELTTEQTVYFEREKSDHVELPIAKETNAGNNGHLSEWITESHSVNKIGADFLVRINRLNLHTQLYIWPKGTKGRWNNIADFGQYYNQPYSPAFNMYEGTLRHEKQHVVEAVNAFKSHEPKFRGDIAKIKEPTIAAAEARYQALFTNLKTNYQTTYWANGEVDGQRIEWEYYHEQFEKFTAEPLTYGLLDWAITDDDAQKILKILDDLEKRGVPGFEKMVKYLQNKALLNRLLDNISFADKKTYKSLIAKIYLLL